MLTFKDLVKALEHTLEREDKWVKLRDPAKAVVRGDIDQIRIKLDQSLELYKDGKMQESITTSRSAYLDSYEK